MAGRTPNLPAILHLDQYRLGKQSAGKYEAFSDFIFHIPSDISGTARRVDMEYVISNMKYDRDYIPEILRLVSAPHLDAPLAAAGGTDPARLLLYFETIIAEQTG
jgi:hypothetical protein